MSHLMTKPTKWSMHQAKTQISLGICPVWPESSQCAQWVAEDPLIAPSLSWVFAGHKVHVVGFVMRRLILFWLFKLGFGHVTLTKTFWANLVFSIWWAVSEAGWLDAMIYLWYLATIASEVHMPYRVKRESLLLADSQVFPEIFHICLPSWLAKFEMSEIILKDHKTSLQNKTKSQYRNDPKFLDRYAWANSADPDQTAK